MHDNDKEYVFCKDYTGKRYIVPLDLKFVEGYPDKDGWYTTLIHSDPERENAWIILHCFENGKVDYLGFFVDTTHPEDVKESEMVDYLKQDHGFDTPTYHAPLQWWLPEVQDTLEVKYGLKELQANIPVLDEVVSDQELLQYGATYRDFIYQTNRDKLRSFVDSFRNACIAIYVKVTDK